MHRFTQLYIEMDRTKRTSEKVAAMERYFRDAPAEDAAWALYFLSGKKIKRLVGSAVLHDAIQTATGAPEWLLGESYEAVGDGAEMMALLYPREPQSSLRFPLHQLVEQRMLALRRLADPARQRDAIMQTWSEMTRDQRLVFNKLLTGAFRVGVAQTLIVRALANVSGVPAAVMAHRFAGEYQPTAESYSKLIDPAEGDASATQQPYPFFLGYPIDQPPEELGEISQWQIEWKYDGIRAQILHRGGEVMIWSRGDELITQSFPEITQSARELPPDTVLDGEIAAWEKDAPLPFALLQRRLNRKDVEIGLWTDVPVAFIAFDVLEQGGRDCRAMPLNKRRQMLQEIVQGLSGGSAIRIAPVLQPNDWNALAAQRSTSRERSVEGVVLKRLTGEYGVGRRRGEWWKWKIDPYLIDAVLIYAQGGSGRRSGLFTDYTFGVWNDGELVPVAKAYSGLTDDEIRQVDKFIRSNTIERHGPVRVVKPELVFELAFEGIQESDRHKAGLAVRFPRMNRWRKDKNAREADTLDTLRSLMRSP